MSNAIQPYIHAIKQAAPAFKRASVDFEREARFAAQIVEANPALQKPGMIPSLRSAIENVALIDITLNPAMKLAYLVPRGGRACLDISYMGLIKIATDSGSVKSVVSRVVYRDDFFEVIQGTEERIVHKPNPFSKNKSDDDILGVYCVATLADGTTMHEIMSKDEIDAVRKRSKASTGPWVTDYAEMARKTVVKRASKYWPKTQRLSQAVHVLDDTEGLVDAAIGDTSERTAKDELLEKQREVGRILKEEAARAGKPMMAYAKSIGVHSIKGMSIDECIEFIKKHSAEDAEIVEDGNGNNSGNQGVDSGGTKAVDSSESGDSE